MVNLTILIPIVLMTLSTVWADGLNARAKTRGRYWGTAITTAVLDDPTANAIARDEQEFGSYTCEYEMKFDVLQPSRGVFDYTAADRIVAQAQANGILMRCHNLIWHNRVPAWLANSTFDRGTMIDILETHIHAVVSHFKGSCYAWDVVNEALNDDGSYRTSDSIWYRGIGLEYIPMAFKAARAADPSAKLYYNDYNCERAGPKATAAMKLIRMVREAGAVIDGVGFQGHFVAGDVGDVAPLARNLQDFDDIGVDVAFTEVDIAQRNGTNQLKQQANDYATIVKACLQVRRCVGITAWGFTDAYTWLGGQDPLIWDANYRKKPAYYAILDAWGGGAGRDGRGSFLGIRRD